MEEGGIAHDGRDAPVRQAGLAHADGRADGGAHADAGVHRRQRRGGAKGVAPDVAADRGLELGQDVERAAVRATGAQHRRPHGNAGFGFGRFRRGRAQQFGAQRRQPRRIEFHHAQLGLRLHDGDARGADLFGQHRIGFLDDDQALHARRERADFLDGRRAGEADLENRRFGEDFLHVLVGHAGGDESKVAGTGLRAVEGSSFRQLAQGDRTLFDGEAHQAAVRGHRDVALGVLDVGDARDFAALAGADVDDGGGVRRARGGADDDGHLVFFAQLEAGDHHVVGFLRIGRLEQQALGELRERTVVLLVLRGMHAGVVGVDDHHAADGADVGEGHQRVHRHVESDVLHGDQGADAGEGGADADFHGDLLVDRPLAVDGALEFGHVLQDFGGGRAGIGGGHAAAGAIGGPSDGLVGGKQFFHGRIRFGVSKIRRRL